MITFDPSLLNDRVHFLTQSLTSRVGEESFWFGSKHHDFHNFSEKCNALLVNYIETNELNRIYRNLRDDFSIMLDRMPV